MHKCVPVGPHALGILNDIIRNITLGTHASEQDLHRGASVRPDRSPVRTDRRLKLGEHANEVGPLEILARGLEISGSRSGPENAWVMDNLSREPLDGNPCRPLLPFDGLDPLMPVKAP